LELKIRFDGNGLPFLGDDATLYYYCIANRKDSGEDADPLAYVQISDKEAGRLCYLVQTGDRQLEYIIAKYPYMFSSIGSIWRNRLPQGEPFLL
jgi:hypothetical protein